MVDKRSVSFNEYTLDVISKAMQIWPENADNFSGLVQSIIADWDRTRSDGGGKFQRLNARMDSFEQVQEAHTLMLKLICDKLSVEVIDHVP